MGESDDYVHRIISHMYKTINFTEKSLTAGEVGTYRGRKHIREYQYEPYQPVKNGEVQALFRMYEGMRFNLWYRREENLYVPDCFAPLRKDRSYLRSFQNRYILPNVMGKSGSLVFYTGDMKYVIKQIRSSEKDAFLRKKDAYLHHLEKNPNSFLNRVMGLYKFRLGRLRYLNENRVNLFSDGKPRNDGPYSLCRIEEISNYIKATCQELNEPLFNEDFYFLVLENTISPFYPVTEIYDLKGSSYQRKRSHHIVKKDKDWQVHPEVVPTQSLTARSFLTQLKKDTEFLHSQNMIDYSLLLVVSDLTPHDKTKDDPKNPAKKNIKFAMYQEGELDMYSCSLFTTSQEFTTPTERKVNQVISGNTQYSMAIIDIFTEYTWKKKIENFIHNLCCVKDGSCVPPSKYLKRFRKMILKVFNS